MEHIAALLLIIGCSQDLADCRELPAPMPVVFETAEECDSVLPSIARRIESDDARLFARCIEVDPALEEMDAELVWDVTDENGLVASVEVLEEPIPGAGTHVAWGESRNDAATIIQR